MLNRIGDLDVAERRREGALKSFRRGLQFREQIVEHFGETPQRLSDVVVSRFKLAQGEPERAVENLTAAWNARQTLIGRDRATTDQRE